MLTLACHVFVATERSSFFRTAGHGSSEQLKQTLLRISSGNPVDEKVFGANDKFRDSAHRTNS